MTGQNILIVEDEASLREMVRMTLEGAGFRVAEAGDAEEAVAVIARAKPDLILLDWMLPGVSGVDLAKRFRRDLSASKIPIIMLTARVEEDDKILGLNAGADDYVTKPFSTRELIARINAVLRRAESDSSDIIETSDGLRLDRAQHRVTSGDRTIVVGPTEYRLLDFFMTHPERVFSRGQLLDYVWGTNVYVEERTVDVHIRRLRKALEEGGHDRLVQTVRGVGYRFSEEQ